MRLRLTLIIALFSLTAIVSHGQNSTDDRLAKLKAEAVAEVEKQYVLGQQINLQFAYTLKQRFVEQFGESLEFQGQRYYLFPSAEKVSQLRPDQLLALQFSRQKASYTIGIAQAFAEGKISRAKLAGLPLDEAKEVLMKIKGIGNWTENYALMKTFRYPDAFPLEDAGLHNAIKNQLGLKSKPNLKRVKMIFKKYKGWEAYATLYLWKSL